MTRHLETDNHVTFTRRRRYREQLWVRRLAQGHVDQGGDWTDDPLVERRVGVCALTCSRRGRASGSRADTRRTSPPSRRRDTGTSRLRRTADSLNLEGGGGIKEERHGGKDDKKGGNEEWSEVNYMKWINVSLIMSHDGENWKIHFYRTALKWRRPFMQFFGSPTLVCLFFFIFIFFFSIVVSLASCILWNVDVYWRRVLPSLQRAAFTRCNLLKTSLLLRFLLDITSSN